MNFFGRKREAQTVAVKQKKQENTTSTIVQLRTSMETFEKRQEHIQKKADAMLKEAQAKMKAKNKQGALFAMKRKKLYDTEILKISKNTETLLNQIMNLESSATNKLMLDAMKAGVQQQKRIKEDINVDAVEDLMDDIKEQMQESSEINEAMSQSVGNDEFDDEELLSELNELEEEDLEAMMMSVPSVAAPALDMPSVPSDSMPVVAAAEEADEDEIAMRELEASMAM